MAGKLTRTRRNELMWSSEPPVVPGVLNSAMVGAGDEMDERGEPQSSAAKCRQLPSRLTDRNARTSRFELADEYERGRWRNLKPHSELQATDRLSADDLTQGQIDCLLLVGQHLTSKEIASRLGMSRHTVDQRIRKAMRALGVRRRCEAARIVVGHYGPIFQWHSDSPEPLLAPAAAGHAMRSRTGIPLPFATGFRPRNEMSIALRLVWIVAIAFGAAVSAGMYLAGLESLGRLLAHE
jgi:DNA-binding CsgD family transcriptional regulator